jgi:predicted metal-binding membrane protein
MTSAARERLHVRLPILVISAVAWTLLAVERGGMGLSGHCSVAMLGRTPSLNPGGSLAVGWALMLTAMMGPLLIAPVRHVHDRSFARRRTRAIMLFVAAYAAIWMAAGVILLALALSVRFVAPDSSVIALVMLVVLVWEISPAKQSCLNRGHAHPELAAFGPAADRDALRFGVTHGVWCVASCWALMLLPFLVSRGHIAAMAIVTLWISGERLERPKPPRWALRSPAKAARTAAAQTRTWLQRSRRNFRPEQVAPFL